MNGTGGIKHSLQAKIAEPEGMDRIPKVNIQAPNAVPWRQLVEDIFRRFEGGLPVRVGRRRFQGW